MAMEVKIEGQELNNFFQELVKGQIVAMFTPEKRDALVKASIEHILTGKGDYSGRSPLTVAFDNAVTAVLKEVVEAEVKNNPAIRDGLQVMVSEALAKSILAPVRHDKLIEKLSTLFGEFLSARY